MPKREWKIRKADCPELLMFTKIGGVCAFLMKVADFCGPFQPTMLRIFVQLFLVFCFCILLSGGCTQKQSLHEEYNQIGEAASKLEGAQVFILDADSSYVTWRSRNRKGTEASGKFRPSKGSLVIEDGGIVAGFLEGDLFSDVIPDANPTLNLEKEKKMLIDSFPVLQTARGRLIRFDITQSERIVDRSDFRQTIALQTDSIPGISLRCNLELADSLLAVSITSQQIRQKNKILLKGNHVLNAREFGLFSIGQNPSMVPLWTPEIPLVFHLIFSPLKK
jgi:hypothetical protein